MKGFATTKNRILKAKKIEAVLTDYLHKQIKGFNILDIGAGDGTISGYFSEKNKVCCIDIEDQRINRNAIFKKVDSTKLPFKDDEFDIVISNQVIEHLANPKEHLTEIKRVLKKSGVCYLATPNKNFPIEPHYKIPLIHYLPNKYFYEILKILKMYSEPIFLISYNNLKHLFKEDYFYNEYTHLVLKYPHKYKLNIKLFKILPLNLIKRANIIMPSTIFILVKK